MASFLSFLAMLMVFLHGLIVPSLCEVQFSTISAAPTFLPEAPLSSSLPPPTQSLSPDIEPLFPTPGASSPSPTESSLPTIPASPSPPNPDSILAPEGLPLEPVSPSPTGSLPESSSVLLLASTHDLVLALFLTFLVFWSL